MTSRAVPADLDDLQALVGRDLGVSAPWQVTQERVDAFAEVTGDHQWIHVDPERAAAAPLGGTIAHGLLTLSLGPRLLDELLSLEAFPHALNYGYDRVRFPSPLPVGSTLRMRLAVSSFEATGDGASVRVTQTFLRDDATKPVCVAEAMIRVVTS